METLFGGVVGIYYFRRCKQYPEILKALEVDHYNMKKHGKDTKEPKPNRKENNRSVFSRGGQNLIKGCFLTCKIQVGEIVFSSEQ